MKVGQKVYRIIDDVLVEGVVVEWGFDWQDRLVSRQSNGKAVVAVHGDKWQKTEQEAWKDYCKNQEWKLKIRQDELKKAKQNVKDIERDVEKMNQQLTNARRNINES